MYRDIGYDSKGTTNIRTLQILVVSQCVREENYCTERKLNKPCRPAPELEACLNTLDSVYINKK